MTISAFFHDSFDGTGDFTTRSPNVGGAYSAPYSDDLSTLTVDGFGDCVSGNSTAAAGSALAGTPTTSNYAIKSCSRRHFLSGTDVAIFVEAYARVVTGDRKLVGFKFLRDDLGSGLKWYLEPFVGNSSGTALYNPSPIDVDAEVARIGAGFNDEDIRVLIGSGGVTWLLHGVAVATTTQVPDVPPQEIVLRNSSADNTNCSIDWLDLQAYSINDADEPAMTSPIYLDRMDGTATFDARTPDVGAAYVQPVGYTGDPANMIPDGSGSLPCNLVDDPDPYSAFTHDPTVHYTQRFLFTPTANDGTGFGYLDLTAYDSVDNSWLVEFFLQAESESANAGTPMWLLGIFISDQTFTTLDQANLDVTPLLSVGTQAELKGVVTPSGVKVYLNGTPIWFTLAIPDVMPHGAMVGMHTEDTTHAQHADFNLDEFEFLVPASEGPITISVPLATLSLAGLAPTLFAGAQRIINVPLARLTLGGVSPSVSGPAVVDPDYVFQPPGLILTEDMPLPTSKLLGQFAEDKPLAYRFGDLTKTRIVGVKLSPTQWFFAIHPMVIKQVWVNDLETTSFEFKVLSGTIGKSYTVVNLAAPAPDNAVVSASGYGATHPVTGAVIDNPADIIEYLMAVAGRKDLWWGQLRSEAAVAGVRLAGSVTEIKSIRAQIDEITDSAGAIWSYGMGRLYPVTADPTTGFVLELNRYQVSNLEVSAALADTADILQLSYGRNDAENKPVGLIEFTASPIRFGKTIMQVTAPWCPDAKTADGLGRRLLSRAAGVRLDLKFQAEQSDQVRPGTWVKLVGHPQWPFDNDPYVMLTSCQLSTFGDQAQCEGETLLSYPTITITNHTLALANTKAPGIAISEDAGIATIVLTDTSTSQPLVGAFVTLDGGAPKKTDARGSVTFPVVPGDHKLAVKAAGFDDQTVDIIL